MVVTMMEFAGGDCDDGENNDNDSDDNNSNMPDCLSAYRTKYSCDGAVTKLTNNLLWYMEKQQASFLAAIDLSAAFDTVYHNILLFVL